MIFQHPLPLTPPSSNTTRIWTIFQQIILYFFCLLFYILQLLINDEKKKKKRKKQCQINNIYQQQELYVFFFERERKKEWKKGFISVKYLIIVCVCATGESFNQSINQLILLIVNRLIFSTETSFVSLSIYHCYVCMFQTFNFQYSIFCHWNSIHTPYTHTDIMCLVWIISIMS